MEHGIFRLTVYFEEPFWVGMFERENGGTLEACKHTFGAEPRDGEVYELILKDWNRLDFSPPVEALSGAAGRINPKRMQREVSRALKVPGVGTKAQQAIQQQLEAKKQDRKTQRRRRDAAEEIRQFELRQNRKKEKHRGR